MLQTGQLPGITFEIEPPQPAEVLPRMDIAAFVGFASAGPLHIPVPVEDVARFRDIFGPDLALARAPVTEPATTLTSPPESRPQVPSTWTGRAGQMQYAHLGPAVEAFFRNGGRRCWIVRVASGETAAATQFLLPGLIEADTWQPALARARSVGSWSDSLRVQTIRHGEAIGLATLAGTDNLDLVIAPTNYRLGLRVAPDQLGRDDLLQLAFEADGPLCYLLVADITPGVDRQIITGQQAFWFLRYAEAALIPSDATVTLLAGRPATALPVFNLQLAAGPGDTYMVEFEQVPGQRPLPGDILRLDFSDGRVLLLSIADIVNSGGEASPVEKTWTARAEAGLWPVTESEGLSRSSGLTPAIERLNFELLVWQGQELQARLDNLAFSSQQTRSWTTLPTDEFLFRLVDGRPVSPEPDTRAAAAATPRFSLAGPETVQEIYLPLGMLTAPDPDVAHPPIGQPGLGDRLERNGLTRFTADLFLDRDLARIGYGALLAEADYKYSLRGELPQGLHCLLPLDEVTLVAIPDAVQPGWVRVQPPQPEVLLPPSLELVPPINDSQRYLLRWTTTPEAEAYILQEANDPAFLQAATRYEGPELELGLLPPLDCPKIFAYRVRARRGTLFSPWSNTVSLVAPARHFEACIPPDLDAPDLALISTASPPEMLELTWTLAPGASTYVVETAGDPAFLTASTIYQGPESMTAVVQSGQGIHYYRVRAERDRTVSPWSNTEIFVASPVQVWEMVHPKEYTDGDLLAVQRALVRFCAARGDLLAVLAMPAHYRQDETLAHVRALRPYSGQAFGEQTGSGEVKVAPLTSGEVHALSFSAVFHPWPATPAASFGRETYFLPPDGPVCGTIAARTIKDGAWVAPANLPLQGVVAINPEVTLEGWQRLYASQVNVVRRDPRGFLLLSANTLSTTTDLALINVRRLLILLRRLALREGAQFTFAPNSETFREIVHFKFEQLLADLFRRGAFAGRDPTAAFQVVTDDSVNTPASIDQGRFIIELRVAPSHPLAFITIRLVQQRSNGVLVQEV